MTDGERQSRRRIAAIVCAHRPWRFAAAILLMLVALFGLTDARSRARAASAAATQPVTAILVSARILSVDSSMISPDWGVIDVERLIQAAGPDAVT